MKKWILWIVTLVTVLANTLSAQDITGNWQGTIKQGRDLRVILEIAKGDDGSWKATLYSIDRGPDAIPANSLTLQGSNLKIGVWAGATYEGTISPDGATITGTWNEGTPRPLDLQRATQDTAWLRDQSPHTVQFVRVDNDVTLEVLDWGGSGRPVVLLAGLGNTAHKFDKFALKLTAAHHVYGITRRGFGESSVPVSGYSADRLGDDVLAVIDFLKLDRPVLVGHSIAGEELSSVGSRYPDKVAGLVYLDAGYPYAYYDRSRGDWAIDALDLRGKLEQLQRGKGPQDRRPLIRDLLENSLPQMERALKDLQKDLEAVPPKLLQTALSKPVQAIFAGQQKYTEIPVPALAIYALPQRRREMDDDPVKRAAAEARELVTTGAQARAFELGVPSARVVRLPNADHYVFLSNEADVLREMNAFLSGLK
ncbi:MAG: alpha/beta fold hydrolase [Thermoanaerobaculia bacterium]